ncbi:MAG: galactose oxidase early set domain-containing protein [Planctomycetota bacterium]
MRTLLLPLALLAAPGAVHAQVTPSKGGSPEALRPLAPCVRGEWEPAFQHDISTFTNPPPPEAFGLFNAIHLALIPVGPERGKVLTMDRALVEEYPAQRQRAAVLDLSATLAPAFQNFEIPMPAAGEDGFELFCSGHVWLPSGELLLAGGTLSHSEAGPGDDAGALGVSLTYTWDATTGTDATTGVVGTWTRQPDLLEARYYPTTVLTGTDDVVVLGGTGGPDGHSLNNYEVWRTDAGAWQPTGTGLPFDGPSVSLHGYPRMTLLSSGELLLSGMETCAQLLDHGLAPGVWTAADCSPGPTFHFYNSSVLFPGLTDVVWKVGGLVINEQNDVSMNPVFELDLSAGTTSGAAWELVPQPAVARSHANVVILPNGDLFLTGGYAGTGEVDDDGILTGADVVLPLRPELYSQLHGQWFQLAPAVSPRDYHSSALLLPDGRVLTAGGDIRLVDYQVYRPWYLTCGEPRPVLLDAPANMKYQNETGQTYDIEHEVMPGEDVVEKAVLVAPGSVTHHSDFQQRYVELPIVQQSEDELRVRGPDSSNHAPRGTYMLFLISAKGIPSEAGWVRLK